MTLSLLARGTIAAAVTTVTTASITAESLSGLLVGLTYHQITFVHGIVVPFSSSNLLLLLLLLLK